MFCTKQCYLPSYTCSPQCSTNEVIYTVVHVLKWISFVKLHQAFEMKNDIQVCEHQDFVTRFISISGEFWLLASVSMNASIDQNRLKCYIDCIKCSRHLSLTDIGNSRTKPIKQV